MEFRSLNLSLLKNYILSFDNTVKANKSCINMPIIHNECVIGIIIDVTEEIIRCRIWDKFIRFRPEFSVKENGDCGLHCINMSLPVDEINKQQEIEKYVAIEMYKQFMNDDPSECAKVRKQILKKQEVNYFKNKTK